MLLLIFRQIVLVVGRNDARELHDERVLALGQVQAHGGAGNDLLDDSLKNR